MSQIIDEILRSMLKYGQGWESFPHPKPRPSSWSALPGCSFGEGQEQVTGEPCRGHRPVQWRISSSASWGDTGSPRSSWHTSCSAALGTPSGSAGTRGTSCCVTPSRRRQEPSPPLFVVLFLKHQRRAPTSVCWKRGASPPLSAAAKSPAHFQTRRS